MTARTRRPAFPWARHLSADQLAAFLEELWGAAGGDNTLATLDAVESVIHTWRQTTGATHDDPSPCPLTERELDILTQIANGATYQIVAHSLGISTVTVRTHVSKIIDRLEVQNATQAVAVATRAGWLTGLRIPQPSTKPPSGGAISGLARHRTRAAELRAAPGSEAVVGTYGTRHTARSTASGIRRGQLSPYQPAGAYTAWYSRKAAGMWVVHARYLGEPTTTEGTPS
ncbi:response regulator transcription factor [Streptomyces echinoruber]|uniref:HTH luxR-type domain-containing protein n=1 Tax=Streptomyces echinoruber TaxID=68898 RepID=A0A918RJ98_9ACTN|nr:LuxR C-terminal-related transcriptional regulator [Streptomyces echinoruber]GHA00952.1 hypothetical protein GCM10010389_45310 [Streptomyces echinoruber]